MNVPAPLRILALLEAASITGTAKAVLEMSYEAQADSTGQPGIQIFVANFARGDKPVDTALTRALDAAEIPFSLIRESGRFDSSVIPQIQQLIETYNVQAVWTNSVKSHFLVNKAKVQKACKWVAFHHGYTSTDFKMRLYNQLDRFSLPNADRVLTVCEPFAAQMEARGVRRSRIRVQHMPIRPFVNTDEDAALLRAELGLDPTEKVILSVGRLSHEKGHADLIRAFALLREQVKLEKIRLLLVGDGPEWPRLEKQAKDLKAAEQVIFAGHRDDATRFYGIATAFALPSFTEGTPNVLLEAMAAGVPVVATDVGGIPELAQDGRNALLAPPRNPSMLANALQRIMQSTALRSKLVASAADVVAAHSPRAYFESMRNIFVEVAQK